MHYTLHQLAILRKVVELESITKAANELHLTQPAISIQLKKLQEQFDIPLTEVVGRKLYVTEFGHHIAELSKHVLEGADRINETANQYKGLLTGKLKISSASTGKYVIPYFLSSFIEEHKGINLILDVTNKTQVINSLKNNEIDFALVSVIPDEVEVEEEVLMKNELYMVGNKKEFDDSLPYIYREEGSATRKAMDDFLGESLDRKRLELTSNEAVKQAVIAGLGQSIIPKLGITNELNKGELFLLPTKGLPITTMWRLVWLKGKNLSPVAMTYLEYIREHRDDIMQTYFN